MACGIDFYDYYDTRSTDDTYDHMYEEDDWSDFDDFEDDYDDYDDDDYGDNYVDDEFDDEFDDWFYDSEYEYDDYEDCDNYFDYNEPISERSKYVPEISKDAIKAIIKKEMDKQNVTVEEIPKERVFTHPKNHKNSQRYFETKGFAWFVCMKSHNNKGSYKRWSSAHSWCFIDLKEQKICYRDKQKCKKHNTTAEIGPEFTKKALEEKMAKYVVKSFLIKTGRNRLLPRASTQTKQTEGGPHDEASRRKGRSCWKTY